MVSFSRVATRVHRSEGSVKILLSTASSSTRFLSVVVWVGRKTRSLVCRVICPLEYREAEMERGSGIPAARSA